MEGGPVVMVTTKQLLKSDHQVPSWTREIRGGGGCRWTWWWWSLFVTFVLPDVEYGEPVVHIQLCGK